MLLTISCHHFEPGETCAGVFGPLLMNSWIRRMKSLTSPPVGERRRRAQARGQRLGKFARVLRLLSLCSCPSLPWPLSCCSSAMLACLLPCCAVGIGGQPLRTRLWLSFAVLHLDRPVRGQAFQNSSAADLGGLRGLKTWRPVYWSGFRPRAKLGPRLCLDRGGRRVIEVLTDPAGREDEDRGRERVELAEGHVAVSSPVHVSAQYRLRLGHDVEAIASGQPTPTEPGLENVQEVRSRSALLPDVLHPKCPPVFVLDQQTPRAVSLELRFLRSPGWLSVLPSEWLLRRVPEAHRGRRRGRGGPVEVLCDGSLAAVLQPDHLTDPRGEERHHLCRFCSTRPPPLDSRRDQASQGPAIARHEEEEESAIDLSDTRTSLKAVVYRT